MSFYDNHQNHDHHHHHGHHHHDHHHDYPHHDHHDYRHHDQHYDHHHDQHYDHHHDHHDHHHRQLHPQTYYQPPPVYSPPPSVYSHAPPYPYPGEIDRNSFRIYTKAGKDYSLSICDNTVILATTNPRDEYQHWYKDFRWANEVKDEEGHPAFALINKATGLAIKHSHGPTHPVRLIPFNPSYLDESILWTEGHDTGKGFRSIRMVNNTRLGFDAFHGDKNHGGVHEGTTIVLWEFVNGKNQRWKISSFY